MHFSFFQKIFFLVLAPNYFAVLYRCTFPLKHSRFSNPEGFFILVKIPLTDNPSIFYLRAKDRNK